MPATPNGTIWDTIKWQKHCLKIMADASNMYYGATDLLNDGRILEYQSLYYEPNEEREEVISKINNNIREMLNTMFSFPNPRYHLIRTLTGERKDRTMDLIKLILNEMGKINEVDFDSYEQKGTLDDIKKLSTAPQKHTII